MAPLHGLLRHRRDYLRNKGTELIMCPLFLAEALNNFFNFLEIKVYLDKPSLQSGDVWSHRLHHLFSTNKAENMFEAYHAMSQSNCHRLSFGIPAPVFLVWIEPDVIISGYTYFIKCEWQCIRTNKKNIVSNVERLSIHLVLHKSLSLHFVSSREGASITVVKNFCRFGELSKKQNGPIHGKNP